MMNASQTSTTGTLQLDDFCRICLVRKPQLRPLPSQYSTGVMIPEMLFKVTGALLNLQEQLPRVICDRCLVKLDLAYSISEEFRKQEELLRRFWFKGVSLVDQLVEYGVGEESRRKPYSEEVIERLAGPPVSQLIDKEVHDQSTNLNGMVQAKSIQPVVPEQKPFDTTEFCIEILSDDSNDEALAVHRKAPDEPTSDPELEMMMELEDLQTSSVLPAQMREQLVKQEFPDDSPAESEAEQDDDDKDSDYVPDEIVKDRVDKDSTKVQPFKCKHCPMTFRYQSRLVAHQARHKNDESGQQLSIDEDQRSVSRSSSASQQRESKYCGKSFRWETQHKNHEKHHERQGVNVSPSLLPKENKQDGIMQCKLCPRIYSTLSYLVKHMKVDHEQEMAEAPESTTPNTSYKCTHCKQSFDAEWKLEEHKKRHKIVESGKYQCKKCNQSFSSQYNLDRHERTFESQCPLHIVRDGKTLFKCPQCYKVYISRNNYAFHAKSHHTPKPEAFQCPDCGKRFYQRTNLRIHQQQAHNSFVKAEEAEEPAVKEAAGADAGTTVLHCIECDTLFQTQESYEAHLREHQSYVVVEANSGAGQEEANDLTNQTSVLPVAQAEVNPSFNNEVALEDATQVQQQTHQPQQTTEPEMIVLTSDDESDDNESSDSPVQLPSTSSSSVDVDLAIRNGVCHICDAIFNNKREYTIRKHMIRHENIMTEKYKCEVCDRLFDTNAKLQQHRRLMHNINAPQEMECEKCQRFVKLKRYQTHLDFHENVEQRLFVCECCDKAFRSKNHLTRHNVRCKIAHHESSLAQPPVAQKTVLMLEEEQRVEREGRFKCNECGKRFKNWESIVSHTSMHRAIKEGLYKCQICEAHCPSNSHLETHMMQEHPQPQDEQLPLGTDQNSMQQQPMETD